MRDVGGSACTRLEGAHPEDPEWQVDEYFRPGQLRSWWTTLFQCGEYDEAADRLRPLLASHRIDLPEDSIEFKQLASEGMRYAIAAFQEAEETIEAGRLDDGALVRLRRQLGRLPADGAATGGLPGGNVVDVFSRTALSPRPDGRSPDSDPATVPFPSSFDVPVTTDLLRKVYTKFVEAKQEAGAWKQEAVDDAWKALELCEELIGVMSIGDIEHSHANAFRARILLLPKYHGKGRFIQRRMPAMTIVVAELRPSALREASLLMSRAAVVFTSPQAGQKMNRRGRNHARRPRAPISPSGLTT